MFPTRGDLTPTVNKQHHTLSIYTSIYIGIHISIVLCTCTAYYVTVLTTYR